jgi:hypothetical protein
MRVIHPHPRRHVPLKSSPFRDIILHPITIAIWIVLCTGLSAILWRSMQQMNLSAQRIQDAQKHVQQEEQKGLELIDKLNTADTPYAKEKIIRDELNLQRPEEKVIQMP